MKLEIILISVLALVSSSAGSRILGLLPMPSQSHGILLERLMRELGNRGHHITYVAATPPSSPIPNMTVIHVPAIKDAMLKAFPGFASKKRLEARKPNPWLALTFGYKMGINMCEHILEDPNVKSLVASDESFDLVLGEIMMDESLLAGMAHRFNAPIVAFATTSPSLWANYLVGNPAPASYSSEMMMGYNHKMNLWQRLHNFIYSLALELSHTWTVLPAHDGIMRKYFDSDYPYIGDILKNTSLVLVNHHHSLGFPRPYLPNMVEIAGVHINKPQPLPKHLQTFMDESKNGVVLFSLGSNANSSDMPPQKISQILDGFSRLEQNVLWKFEAELNNLPKNVQVFKWLPQYDILAHPNLKAFITHGGLLSTTEALSLGIPVIGIPLGGDQMLNIKQVEEAGWGVYLDYNDITPDSLYNSVQSVIGNPKYKETAETKRQILLDTPVNSLDLSVWWIEYVLRHSGAQHLKASVQSLTWYQYYLLDVLGVITFLVLFVTSLSYFVFKKMVALVFKRRVVKEKKS